MSLPTRRLTRVEQPFVRVPIRNDQGAIELIDLWREDHLDPGDGAATYLVLDFLDEERLQPVRDLGQLSYTATGKLILELQAVDPITGEGLANPHQRSYSPDIPTPPAPIRDFTNAIRSYEYSTKPLTGLTHVPDSPRRAEGD